MLYRRADETPWFVFVKTVGAIHALYEIVESMRTKRLTSNDGNTVCALIPAPEAEAAVKAWQGVLDCIPPNCVSDTLRVHARGLRRSRSSFVAADIVDAVADALEEAEGETKQDPA